MNDHVKEAAINILPYAGIVMILVAALLFRAARRARKAYQTLRGKPETLWPAADRMALSGTTGSAQEYVDDKKTTYQLLVLGIVLSLILAAIWFTPVWWTRLF